MHPAYLAGILDGEGSISVEARRPRPRQGERSTRYTLTVRVGSNDPQLTAALRKAWSGNLMTRSGGRHHIWTVRNVQAEAVLRAATPYLMVKAEQARLALALRARMAVARVDPRVPMSAAEIAAREELRLAIVTENQRLRYPGVAFETVPTGATHADRYRRRSAAEIAAFPSVDSTTEPSRPEAWALF